MSFSSQNRTPGDLMISLLEKKKYGDLHAFKAASDIFVFANDPRMQSMLSGDVEGERKKLAETYKTELGKAIAFLKDKKLDEREKQSYKAAVEQINRQIEQCLNPDVNRNII